MSAQECPVYCVSKTSWTSCPFEDKLKEKIAADRKKILDYLATNIDYWRVHQTPISSLELGRDVGSARGSKDALKGVVKFIETECL